MTKPKKYLTCPRCTLCKECRDALRYGLTRQELALVRKLCEGLSNRDIATDMNISEETVKRHYSNIMNKTGMDNRVALALMAVREGWVTLGEPTLAPAPIVSVAAELPEMLPDLEMDEDL